MFNNSYQIRSILRIAWLELRAELTGGLGQFRVFLISLALGISAITAVGSLNSAMLAGIKADTKKILGGDLELRLSHLPASPNQYKYLKLNSEKLAQVITMRTMVAKEKATNPRKLVELKAVDSLYPLVGKFISQPNESLPNLLGAKNGVWGGIADSNLLKILNISLNDHIIVGSKVVFCIKLTFF